MEYYFNQFSQFAHGFVGQTAQTLIPAILLTLAVAAALHVLRSVDSAARYKLWLAVMATVIIMPLAATMGPLDFSISNFFDKIAATQNQPIHETAPRTTVSERPVVAKLTDSQNNDAPVEMAALPEANNTTPMVENTVRQNQTPGVASHTEYIPLHKPVKNNYSYSQIILEGFPMIAVIIWMFVFLVLTFRLVLGYRGLKGLKASILPLPQLQMERIDRLTKGLRFKRKMTMGQSDQINVPVSAGFFHSMVIIPTGLAEKLDDRELQSIVVHEMTHLERHDDWMKLIQKFLTALFFYNPAILWIGRRLDLERELACDARVLAIMDQPQVYARCLTKMIQRTIVPVEPTLVTGAILSKKQIFRRIDMILNRKLNSRPIPFGKFAGLVVSILVIAMVAFYTAPALAWPYHPFKFSVIADFVKEKSDSSTATIFHSEKNDKWQRVSLPKTPYIYDIDENTQQVLDTEKLEKQLDAALKAAELDAPDVPNVKDPKIAVPDIDIKPIEPLAPEAERESKSETRFRRSDDYVIDSPNADDGKDSVGGDDGEAYLRQLSKADAKYAEAYGEAMQDYYADKAESARDQEESAAEARRAYAEASASADRVSGIGNAIGRAVKDVENMFNATDGDHYSMIHHDDDGSVAYDWQNGADKTRVEIEGELKMNDDCDEIVQMSDDARVQIYEKKDGVRRELKIIPNADGTPSYAYRYSGKKQDFDDNAREWYRQVMLDCVRKAGFNAAERAEKIYNKDGIDGVLKELNEVESDYVSRLYLSHLIQNFDLKDAELGQIIKYITRNLDSDYEKAEILLSIADVQKDEKFLLDDFVMAAKSLSSDYERGRVLSRLSLDSNVSNGVLIGVLEIAESMDSDYERAKLLSQLSDLQRDDPEFRYALIRAIETISSDYERSRVLQQLLSERQPNKAIASDVLKLVGDMSSDYEKSKLLIYLAGHSARDQNLFRAYLSVIESMSSNYEIRRSLMALGPFYDMDDSTLLNVLNITDRISSDYERSQILKDMVSEVNRSPQVRKALLNSVDDIRSDYESSRILQDIIDKLSFDDEDAARDILAQAEQISSDYEKAQVLSDLIPNLRGKDKLENDLADVIETISSDYERDRLYAELYRKTRGKR